MTRASNHATAALAALAALLTLTACGSGGGNGGSPAPAPAPTPGPPPPPSGVTVTVYDGVSDDLLTAGLGWDGLQSATAPTVSTTPTPVELRRLAIYSNYRALIDMTTDGGYGRLYGPNVDLNGNVNPAPGAGKIAGTEHITEVGGAGFLRATLMVQIPSSFNVAAPCIVTATSSGSRGVYGAVSAAGEWGLKRGCAVAYTDKGTGNGAHELSTNMVTLRDGTTATATFAGNASHFTAPLTDAERLAYVGSNPNRYAYKHAHSRLNPEKDWGAYTLQAIEFALLRLNAQFPTQSFNASNTLVIADSVSNGGGAALAAAEQDINGLIDGVVVSEPQINLLLPIAGINVVRGLTAYPASAIGRTLYDYTSLANLLQPCAAFAAAAVGSPLLALIPTQNAQNRCAALAAGGYVVGGDFASRANDALVKLHDAGWQPESDLLHASHWSLQASTGVTVTYANAYARASAADNLCGFSFATTAVTGEPVTPSTSPLRTLFGAGNGVPPTNGINVVYNLASGGPIVHTVANSDFAYLGAHCLRQLWTTLTPNALALQQGVNEVRLGGNLRGKPALILHGRSDTLVPTNHTSRPYFGMNKLAEGGASRLSYIEVLNAQHFDTFLSLGGYNTAFIPLHYYTIRALDLMWNHLRTNAPLPPSQVVRTLPRGAGAPPLTVAANLPPITLTPPISDQITFNAVSRTVTVPD
jgi:hydroxybutyrate-dimer hydrolase